MGNEYDLDVIDLNARLYYSDRKRLKEILSKLDSKSVVIDTLDLRLLYHRLLNSRKELIDNISWRDYAKIFITVPSWFVTVPTKDIVFLINQIKNQSPNSEFFFYGNSLGTWTDKKKLMAHKIQIRHLNNLFKTGPCDEPVRYDTLPSPVYERRDNYIFDLLPFRLKHGCSWGNCRFCSLARGWNSGYLERSAGKVIEEIEALVDRYNPKMFVCRDNSINGANLLEFCSYFEGITKPWIAMARPDLIENEIEALEKAGCQLIYFGLESGSDRVLKEINKGVSVGQMSEFIIALHHHHIVPAPSLFVGSPSETETDFENTVQFILGHSEYLDIINLYPFRMTPGSDYMLSGIKSNQDSISRLKQLTMVCKDAGIKVCIGEQSAEYFLFKKAYPGHTNHNR